MKRQVIMTWSGKIKLENCLDVHSSPLKLWEEAVVGESHSSVFNTFCFVQVIP